MVGMVLTLGAAGAAVGAWLLERRRSVRRNTQGRCASCGLPWPETTPGEPYLIHGRLTCEPCGEQAKRRLPWHLALLASCAMIGTWIAVVGADVTAWILLPGGSTVAFTAGALVAMKRANRDTRHRIAVLQHPGVGGRDSWTALSR